MYRQPVITGTIGAGIAGARARSIAVAVACGLLAGACSSGSGLTPLDSLLGGAPEQTADASAAIDSGKPVAKTELDKAIEHWGEQYKQKPHDLKAALAYARNLKAAGHKEQAFAVVQSASILHGDSKELASEYGRLALDFEQVALAEKLLAVADDPMKPDWRLISARGTVMAKQGKYAEAIPFYERALSHSANQPSVLNNLAMAHAANGDPAKAEQFLRQASATGNDPKIKQNLALVVGLQGKHDEAKVIAAANMPADSASADTDYIKRMVKVTPTAIPTQPTPAIATRPTRAVTAPRVIEAKSAGRPAGGDSFRPASGPEAVAGPTGAWSTSVSR